MSEKIWRILVGDMSILEYKTLKINGIIKEHVYLVTGQLQLDISCKHSIVCLDPLVFGLWVEKEQLRFFTPNTTCRLYFADKACEDRKKLMSSAVAILRLAFIDKIEEETGALILMRVEKARIYHLNPLMTLILYRKFFRKPSYSFSTYKFTIAAYSYPRKVRVVSFRQGDHYNVFPMDLLADIDQGKRFIFGLKHANVSLPRIMECGRLVVAEASAEYKDIIYRMGKHHHSPPSSPGSLPFRLNLSEQLGCYIPEWVESYKEIRILHTRNLGSHMLLYGECTNERRLKDPAGHLFYTHFLQHLHQKNRGSDYPLV